MALRITGVGEEIAAVSGLPWNKSLELWPEDPHLTEKRGISRHIVRLVRSTDDPDSEVYAVKETVSEFANREYKILRELKQLDAPSVQSVAVVEGRTDQSGEELPCALVTRFLPYSLPYRVLLSGKDVNAEDVTLMANALALLLQYHVKQFTRFCWWSKRSAIYSLQYDYEHFLEPVNLAGQLKHLNNEQTVVDKQWYYKHSCKSTPVLLYKHLGLRTTNNS